MRPDAITVCSAALEAPAPCTGDGGGRRALAVSGDAAPRTTWEDGVSGPVLRAAGEDGVSGPVLRAAGEDGAWNEGAPDDTLGGGGRWGRCTVHGVHEVHGVVQHMFMCYLQDHAAWR